MYQALYRKWRPKTFSDVVGQSHITETLRRQVAEGRTSHAYLFTGTRGTGKTTCAKILAKAVNCERPVDGNPCGECPACLGIDNGSFLDVTELDAASNNGVDQVRALRDEAIYAPANVKWRVYIIDEVHMLTLPAFNALLKILEEPPAHLLFILATTELHKVPATILSRCQRFSFKRIRPEDIAARLAFVASRESIPLTEDGAELLSRLADGALRDGLSLLDQCAAAGGTVDAGAVLNVLGLAGNLQTARLMEHIAARDAGAALTLLGQLYAGGKDVGAVLGELSTLTRDLLVRRTAPEGGGALLSGGYDTAALDRLDKMLSASRLLYLASTLQQTLSTLSFSANCRTDAELCLLRLCDESLSGDLTALSARMDRLEQRMSALPKAIRAGGESPAATSPAEAPSRKKASRPAPDDPSPWEAPAPEEAPPPTDEVAPDAADSPAAPVQTAGTTEIPAAHEIPAAPASDAPPASQSSAFDGAAIPKKPVAPGRETASADGSAVWQELAEACKGSLPGMYRAFLDVCRGTVAGGVVTVYVPDDMTRGRLDNERVLTALREGGESLTGAPVEVRLTVGSGPELTVEERRKRLISFGSQFDSVKIQ